MSMPMDAEFFMNAAYQEALKAMDEGEVPVGAVVEKEGRIIGRGYNRIEKCTDASAHAEILAIGAASSSLWNGLPAMGCLQKLSDFENP